MILVHIALAGVWFACTLVVYALCRFALGGPTGAGCGLMAAGFMFWLGYQVLTAL